MTPQRYFTALLGHSRDIVARLPLSAEPQPIGQCLPRLKSAVAAMEAAETERLSALPRPRPQAENGRARGMNTVGILADRLTILVMKDWALRHRKGDAAAADALLGGEIADMVRALAEAGPGFADMTRKLTAIDTGTDAAGFGQAWYGLLTINVLLWEAQETLYGADLDRADGETLRDYITWFSWGNVRRNAFIALCERLYWQEARA